MPFRTHLHNCLTIAHFYLRRIPKLGRCHTVAGAEAFGEVVITAEPAAFGYLRDAHFVALRQQQLSVFQPQLLSVFAEVGIPTTLRKCSTHLVFGEVEVLHECLPVEIRVKWLLRSFTAKALS